MNRNIVALLFTILIVGGIFGLVMYMKQYTPKYHWDAEYTKNSAQPYGLKLLYSALKKQNETVTIINNRFYEKLDTNQTNTNFISISAYLDIDSSDAWQILKYAEKGNNVFISSNGAPLEILRTFVPRTDTIDDYDDYSDSLITVDFSKTKVPFPKKIKFHYQYLKDTVRKDWSGYHIHYFNDTMANYNFIPLAFINDTIVNCYCINHGKGKIILHSNPILFTNYNIIQKPGFEHANNILSFLNNGPIYWEEPSFSDENNEGNGTGRNPLKFLFSHYTLKWGWYLFTITIFLYLLFRSKREQRIIPLLPKNTNSSIEYTKAIGALYYQKGGHNNIANEMYTLFLSDIRNRYYIFTDIEEEELINQIAIRSEIKKEYLTELFKQFNNVKSNQKSSSKELITLYNSIENYNKNRK